MVLEYEPLTWLYGMPPTPEWTAWCTAQHFDSSLLLSATPAMLTTWLNHRVEQYALPEVTDLGRAGVADRLFSRGLTEVLGDLCARFLLLYCVRAVPRLASWVTRNESALFLNRYRCHQLESPLDTDTRRLLLDRLLGSTNVKLTGTTIKFRWYRVAELAFRWPVYCLKHGWVEVDLTNTDVIEAIMVARYQSLLKHELLTLPEVPPAIADLAASLLEKVTTETTLPELNDVNEILRVSPLCILDLDQIVRSGIGTEHYEAIQIGLYFKAFFSLPQLLTYFFERDGRNTSATQEEFYGSHRAIEAQIKSLYDTDYQVTKCETCQAPPYFCHYVDRPEEIKKYLTEHYAAELTLAPKLAGALVKSIVSCTKKKWYGYACGMELGLRFLAPLMEYYDRTIGEGKGGEIYDRLSWRAYCDFFLATAGLHGLTIYHPLLHYLTAARRILSVVTGAELPVIESPTDPPDT